MHIKIGTLVLLQESWSHAPTGLGHLQTPSRGFPRRHAIPFPGAGTSNSILSLEIYPLLFPFCQQFTLPLLLLRETDRQTEYASQAGSPPLLPNYLNPTSVSLPCLLLPPLLNNRRGAFPPPMVRSSSVASNPSSPSTSWVSLHQQTNFICHLHSNRLLLRPQLTPFFRHQLLPSLSQL